MTGYEYLKVLVEEMHSTTVATIGNDGHPQTRVIDMMYYDEEGVYFLTAKGNFPYAQCVLCIRCCMVLSDFHLNHKSDSHVF